MWPKEFKGSEYKKSTLFCFPAEWTFPCANKRQGPAILQIKRQETARKNTALKTSLLVHFKNANETVNQRAAFLFPKFSKSWKIITRPSLAFKCVVLIIICNLLYLVQYILSKMDNIRERTAICKHCGLKPMSQAKEKQCYRTSGLKSLNRCDIWNLKFSKAPRGLRKADEAESPRPSAKLRKEAVAAAWHWGVVRAPWPKS